MCIGPWHQPRSMTSFSTRSLRCQCRWPRRSLSTLVPWGLRSPGLPRVGFPPFSTRGFRREWSWHLFSNRLLSPTIIIIILIITIIIIISIHIIIIDTIMILLPWGLRSPPPRGVPKSPDRRHRNLQAFREQTRKHVSSCFVTRPGFPPLLQGVFGESGLCACTAIDCSLQQLLSSLLSSLLLLSSVLTLSVSILLVQTSGPTLYTHMNQKRCQWHQTDSIGKRFGGRWEGSMANYYL